MALKIKRLSIRNWMKISQADVAFPDYGLVMVMGHNTASGGALESVGSGKTSFGEALTRTLFGHAGRFTHAKNCSTDRKGDTYLRLECELDGKPLLVENGYKCQEMGAAGEALRYTWNDQVVERGNLNQTRDQLSKLLGVEPMLVPWTVFIDGDDLRFNKMSQASSVEMVLAALRQPPWGTYHQSAKDLAAEFQKDILKLEGTVDSETHRIATARRDVESAKIRLHEANEDYQQQLEDQKSARAIKEKAILAIETRISESRLRLKRIGIAIKKIENEQADDHHKLEIELKDREEHLRKMRERQKGFREKWQAASTKAAEARSHYTTYRSATDVCPTCQRPMDDKKIDPERLSALKQAVTESADNLRKIHAVMEAAESDMSTLEKQLDTVRDSIKALSVETKVRALSIENRDIEESIQDDLQEIQDTRKRLDEAKVSDQVVRAAQGLLEERQRVVREAKAAVKEAADKLDEAKAESKVLDYWVFAFSPYGIPNMVLREALGPLNHEARRISALMTGSTIEVAYSTQKELASGKAKAQLVINVNNAIGSDDIAGSSKGESRLTNLVIAETLSQVGQITRQAGYRWYDEILTNLDKTSRTNILKYLKELAATLKILIFVVDHHTETANFADHVLKVEKLSESAKVSWA